MRPSDQANFDAMYRTHHSAVRRCVASFGLPRSLWQDVLQDTWITAFRRIDALVAHPRPVAWLCTVARNCAMHCVRGRLRRQNKHLALAAESSRISDDPIAERDAWDTLDRLLAGCSLEQREVYLKIELFGMTANEVAEELGLPVNTVYSRLRKAREHLRGAGAALASLLLLLRTRFADAVYSAPQGPSGDELALMGPATAAQASRTSGVVGKLALVAFLVIPTSSSRHVEESPVVRHVAQGASLEEHDSVHREGPWIPWAPLSPAGPEVSPGVASEPPAPGDREVRRPRVRSAVPQPEPRMVVGEDGEDLYRAAREAYRAGRYERSLAAALRHRARYPVSQLCDSRELLVAQIYCALGREADARAQVRSFALESPEKGAHRARLAQLPEECR